MKIRLLQNNFDKKNILVAAVVNCLYVTQFVASLDPANLENILEIF